MQRILLGHVDDMAVNSVRQILVDGAPPIALYRLADGFFATADLCSHGEASLAEGDIEGDEIVCPFHLGKFDIRSGAPTAAPCLEPIAIYPIVIETDQLYIEFP